MTRPTTTPPPQPAAGPEPRPGAETGQKSITHALRALLVLADARKPLGVTELAQAIGLHKSSASRILATLRSEKFVERDPVSGRNQLGLGILSLAGVVLSKYRLPSGARQRLEQLAEQTGETVTISAWNGEEAVNVDQILGSRSSSHYSPPGRINPAHCTATGKVFLAFADEPVVDQVLEGPLPRFTPKTVTSVRALRKEIQAVRRVGYAVGDREFLADVASIAAPVFDSGGAVLYVIAVTLQASRFDAPMQARLAQRLLAVAGELSVRTGPTPSTGVSSANWQ